MPEGETLKRLDIILNFTLNGPIHLECLQLDMWYGEEGQKKMFRLYSPNNRATFNVTDTHAPMANDSGVKNKAKTTGFTPTFKYGFLPFFVERKDEVVSFPIIKDVCDTLA